MTAEWDDENVEVLTLTGPLARAWGRILVANEWFDGETYFQRGAQDRLIREWNENKPSRVQYLNVVGSDWLTRDFPTRRDAERWLDEHPQYDYSTVKPI